MGKCIVRSMRVVFRQHQLQDLVMTFVLVVVIAIAIDHVGAIGGMEHGQWFAAVLIVEADQCHLQIATSMKQKRTKLTLKVFCNLQCLFRLCGWHVDRRGGQDSAGRFPMMGTRDVHWNSIWYRSVPRNDQGKAYVRSVLFGGRIVQYTCSRIFREKKRFSYLGAISNTRMVLRCWRLISNSLCQPQRMDLEQLLDLDAASLASVASHRFAIQLPTIKGFDSPLSNEQARRFDSYLQARLSGLSTCTFILWYDRSTVIL